MNSDTTIAEEVQQLADASQTPAIAERPETGDPED
jgi:hypothetical protein